MHETMIERVAKAIQEQIPGWLREDGTVNDEHLAIAAIKAMREPTRAMLDAGNRARMNIQGGYGGRGYGEAVIDAALSEGGE